MERITKKAKNGEYGYNEYSSEMSDAIRRKLGKYEDIDEKVGVQYDIIYDAVKYGFYYMKEGIATWSGLPVGLLLAEGKPRLAAKQFGKIVVNIDEFGKTWDVQSQRLTLNVSDDKMLMAMYDIALIRYASWSNSQDGSDGACWDNEVKPVMQELTKRGYRLEDGKWVK